MPQNQHFRSNTSIPVRFSNSASHAEYMIRYPILPDNVDFETFRKTNDHFKDLQERFVPVTRTSGVLDDEMVDSEKKRDRTRYIMMTWPRDPKGEPLDEMPDGKMTSNGLPLWGATLFDFYFIPRFPDTRNLMTALSGSKIARWMRQKNELYAMDYLDQAENDEPEPKVMQPYYIGEFIELIEKQVHLKKAGRSMIVDKTASHKISSCLLPPSEYPGRWPLRPFSTPTCHLQERIPFDKLPKRLIVHDPFGCLKGMNRSSFHDEKWPKMIGDDVVHTYILVRNTEVEGEFTDVDTTAADGTQEAHLYITPKRCIGAGHHSHIYQVELELPRELLVKPKTCLKCAYEGPGEALKKTVTEKGNINRVKELFEVKKQHAPYCKHLDDGVPRPKSAKVSVTAKVTMPRTVDSEDHEQHLANEAWRYMNFPDHFFEHWTGYNIIPPCKDPLPIGAVVPQFYGYYRPQEQREGEFMSPILLLEHCGIQANMNELTLEERRECWSLLERLNLGGFVHNSVFERNILIQNGPVQWSPFKRSSLHPRFRLIDFGRCEKTDDDGDLALNDRFNADVEFRLDFYHPAHYLQQSQDLDL